MLRPRINWLNDLQLVFLRFARLFWRPRARRPWALQSGEAPATSSIRPEASPGDLAVFSSKCPPPLDNPARLVNVCLRPCDILSEITFDPGEIGPSVRTSFVNDKTAQP